MRHIAAIAIVLLASIASAEEMRTITDDQVLTDLLVQHDLTYPDGAHQQFMASGRTLYTFGEPSWGNWRPVAGQYCSQWPPSATWACYDVAYDGGTQVRFTDEWGNTSVGTFAE